MPLQALPPYVQDGFPAGLARSNGFQRHATLLVYLNSTQEVSISRRWPAYS